MRNDLKQYFERTDTPMTNSPVGSLMQRILDESPEMPFEKARSEAQRLLNEAAGRKKFSPRTPQQDQKSRLAAQKLRNKR